MLVRLRAAGIGAWTAGPPGVGAGAKAETGVGAGAKAETGVGAGAEAGAGAIRGPLPGGDEEDASLIATVDIPGGEDALNTAVQAIIGSEAAQGLSSELHRSLVSDVHTRLRRQPVTP